MRQMGIVVMAAVALADAPVAEAAGRGEHRALYACGAVFALAVEGGAAAGHRRRLVRLPQAADRRQRGGGVLTRVEWLDALDAVSDDASLRRDMEVLLDQGSPQAGEVAAGLLERAGVAVRREDGRVVLE